MSQVSKCLSCMHKEMSLIVSTHSKSLGLVTSICNLSKEQRRQKWKTLGLLARQPSQVSELQVQWERLCLKKWEGWRHQMLTVHNASQFTLLNERQWRDALWQCCHVSKRTEFRAPLGGGWRQVDLDICQPFWLMSWAPGSVRGTVSKPSRGHTR